MENGEYGEFKNGTTDTGSTGEAREVTVEEYNDIEGEGGSKAEADVNAKANNAFSAFQNLTDADIEAMTEQEFEDMSDIIEQLICE